MFWITKAALRHTEPRSSIIITSSVNAYDPDENLADYAMTKACNMNFTKSMALQLAPKGICINAVAPGPIWIPLQPSGGQFPKDLPQFGADTPMGRSGQPGELAGIYVLLASQEDSYETGQVTADILIETLIDRQVEVIFGLPGDDINGIMEALRTR